MNFLKWFTYILAFTAFVWFVFFRPTNLSNLFAASDPTAVDQGETSGTEEPTTDITSDSIDPYVEDTASYADESTVGDVIDDTYTETTTDETIDESTTDATDVVNSSGSINVNDPYLLLVGSFSKRSNAENFLRKLQSKGKEGVIKEIRGLHRVIAASTGDKADSKNILDQFTQRYNMEAFVLKQ